MTRSLLCCALLWAGAQLPSVAESVQRLVEEAGVEWLLGLWVDDPTSGDHLQARFAFELDGHSLSVTTRSAEALSRGFAYLDRAEARVVHRAVNDQGGVISGEWTVTGDGAAVLTMTYQGPDGVARHYAVRHRRLGDDRMQVSLYPVDEAGEAAEVPEMEVEMKRARARPDAEGGEAEEAGDSGAPETPRAPAEGSAAPEAGETAAVSGSC